MSTPNIFDVLKEANEMTPYKPQGEAIHPEYLEGWRDAISYIREKLTEKKEEPMPTQNEVESLDSTLPVPLGSTVYRIYTNCGDFCYFQRSLFKSAKRLVGKGELMCSKNALCHTQIHTTTDTLGLNNLEFILGDWGKYCFATKEEAEREKERLTKARRERMLALGFVMDEEGYGYQKESPET